MLLSPVAISDYPLVIKIRDEIQLRDLQSRENDAYDMETGLYNRGYRLYSYTPIWIMPS